MALLLAVPDRKALLQVVIGLVRRWTGCEAVGIRLRHGDDYPYYTQDGFPDSFIQAENALCIPAQETQGFVAGLSGAVLECMCGAVISGQIDATKPFFTPGGSFYTGSTSRLLAGVSEAELRGKTRNRCNAAGYETVVLVPLRAADTTHGLLQVNDRRPDCLDLPSVTRLEQLAAGLAILLSRQEMAAALAASEARHRAMFFSNIAVKLLIDPATGSIVDANPAACDFYGFSLDQIQQLSIWDINAMPGDLVRQEMDRAKEEGRGFFQFRHRLANGEVREVEVYSGPVEYLGRNLLFSIIHDVTDRVRAEEARDRVEQMLRHDLRSPLAGIAGLAGHLAESNLSEKQREIAAVIRDTAAGLNEMVGRNLDLCKIEQGRYQLVPQPVPLVPLLRRQAQVAAPLAGRRELALVFGPGLDAAVCEDHGPVVAGEAGLLTTVFSNLLTNALEAAPPGSAVTLSLAAGEGMARATLHNQGVIPEDIRRRFATKYSTSGKPGGTGLGAYTARTIARLHGGDLAWDSSEAAGTSLTVVLPLHAGDLSSQSV
ncbi:sensory box histidine kinase/response regulator [Desulfovibrio sp. DV]|uniref:PAS domain-containing sensor histidine kinase n=1 Tax=Desulfovibrio sp. DV TaxID=1844708 RepID=UPI00095B8169|nr:PAS domain-containing sensor histidine kinase [Desulfovibrio sp. DV]OLN24634.1 sensory box histidine kinase/response regulator [Desulfovibrio sp. DV]